ncbi:hypothetical protein [Aliivibrio kagoshimensis]|uniref:hypothetical protein n=1 Tax=Aliivibrio kagoshimensis TaxID=2910230 RepID=UPI003D0A7175
MKYVIGMVVLFAALNVSATQQIKELFRVGDETVEIRQYPLKDYLEQSTLPDTMKRPICSANWRGYRGSWTVKNRMLVLDHLVVNACSKTPIPIEARDLFSNHRYPVVATWYTGTIMVRAPGSGYIAYRFDKGELISTALVDQ